MNCFNSANCINVNLCEDLRDTEGFDFALLQTAKPGSDQKQFNWQVVEHCKIAIPMHLPGDFCLSERRKTGEPHGGREVVFHGNEIEWQSPAILEGCAELVFGD